MKSKTETHLNLYDNHIYVITLNRYKLRKIQTSSTYPFMASLDTMWAFVAIRPRLKLFSFRGSSPEN